MPECRTEYAVAKFRDIEFEILPVESDGGRRIVTNQYPFSDNHYNEDLGAKASTWTVKGCFTGEGFRDRLTTAKRVWSRTGPGVFFEPTENVQHNVTLVDWNFSYDNAKIEYAEFTLNFVAASETPYPTNLGTGAAAALNASVAVESYLSTVRAVYRAAMAGVNDFNAVSSGLRAAQGFIHTVSRMVLDPLAFLRTRRALDAALPSRAAGDNLQRAEAIFDAAIAGKAPVLFFRRASELRAADDGVVGAQVTMTALTALGYYFEKLASGGVDFAELAEFRERATALKTAEPDAAGAVDLLILNLGAIAVSKCVQSTNTAANALVASYEYFGNISRAREILLLSNGVSGARMPVLVTPCDMP